MYLGSTCLGNSVDLFNSDLIRLGEIRNDIINDSVFSCYTH